MAAMIRPKLKPNPGPVARTRVGSHGLRGMRFRVESENGRLDIASRAGQGTELKASLPRMAQG